jgi:hypothetical protein
MNIEIGWASLTALLSELSDGSFAGRDITI